MKRSFFTKLLALSPLAPLASKVPASAPAATMREWLNVQEASGTWLRFSSSATGKIWSGIFHADLTDTVRLQGMRGLGYDRVHQIIDGAVYETEALEDVIHAWPR